MPPPQTGSQPSPSTAESAPAVKPEPRGTLVVRAIPFATVTVSGQKPRVVQGLARFSLPPGTYKVTFEHDPSGASKVYPDVVVSPNASVERNFDARKK